MKITRDFESILGQRLRDSTPFMQALVGPRQVGKTTAVRSIVESWSGPKIFESADSLQPLSTEWLSLHWQRALDRGAGTLLVIDEIQKIPNWSEAVKKLYDESQDKKLKVVILGSASFRLQRGLADSLAGRYEMITATHWTFQEMRQAFDWSFEDYLFFGGYPGAAPLKEDYQRWRSYILDSIVENVLSRDLVDLAELRNPAMLRQLFFLAMEYPAQEISFQRLVGQLQDKGAVATVKHYLEILESAHLLRLLYKYGERALTSRTSSPKLLPLAPALISAVSNAVPDTTNLSWRGRVFESTIGAALSGIADEIYYWRDRDLEVDFVLKIGKQVYAIEVKSGRPGKTAGLQAFKEKYPSAQCIVVDWEKGKKLLAMKSPKSIREDVGLLLDL